VHFSRYVCVPMRAVDLTVFNPDGSSVMNLKGNEPDGLWPTWASRFKKLQGQMNSTRVQIKDLEALIESGLKPDLFKALQERLLQTDSASGRKVSGSIVDDVLQYELRRVGRLREPLARSLLVRYSRHRARDAFGYPLAAAADA